MPDIDTTYLRDELYDFLKRDDQALDFLFNHVLDGVSALALLKHITDALENPLSLLVAP